MKGKKTLRFSFVALLVISIFSGSAVLAARPLSVVPNPVSVQVALSLQDASSAQGASFTQSASSAPGFRPLVKELQTATVYLPLISRSYPLRTIFGVEVGPISPDTGFDMMAQAGASWVRRNGLLWSSVEPYKGAPRTWSTSLETELINAADNNMNVILIIRGTPDWAQAIPGMACGPIKSDELASFASFVHDVVARYSVGPYNVKYYELWNEPDVSPAQVSSGSPLGCWGDDNDTYYNGGAYGEMLKAVYPQVKAADPAAQVLVGGLLLDCDPGLPGVCYNPKPPMFLEGILADGAGPYFDGVSFHAYDMYGGALGVYGNPYFYGDGPVVSAKAGFLRGVLAAYGFPDKYLINTETALLNWTGGVCDMDCETTKAYYVPQVYVTAIALGLRANVWYSDPNWSDSGLLTFNHTPLPAFTSYQFARAELRSASYLADVTSSEGVMGYLLDRGDRQIMVLWSTDGVDHAETLPSEPLAIWDAFGNAVSVNGTYVNVGLVPLYVEFSP